MRSLGIFTDDLRPRVTMEASKLGVHSSADLLSWAGVAVDGTAAQGFPVDWRVGVKPLLELASVVTARAAKGSAAGTGTPEHVDVTSEQLMTAAAKLGIAFTDTLAEARDDSGLSFVASGSKGVAAARAP